MSFTPDPSFREKGGDRAPCVQRAGRYGHTLCGGGKRRVIGCITGGKDNGTAVLLRADMDALPVSETADNLLSGAHICVSQNKCIMHACGHDSHMAMLLGAAKVLKDMQQLCGICRRVFARRRSAKGASAAAKIC